MTVDAAPPASASARLVSILLVAASVAAMAVSLRWFATADAAAHGAAWQLWLAGVVGLGLAVLPWRGRRDDGVAPVTRSELLVLVVILCVGAAFRLHRLDSQPYGVWFDEAANGVEAMRILDNPSYRPVFVAGRSQMAAMFFYYCAGFVHWFGANIYALRLATTVLGMIAILGVWRLGRDLWRPEVGLIAAAFLAVSRWHVNFSRFAMVQISMTVFIPIVLWLFTRALRRESPRAAVWAGLVLGLGLQFYYSMMSAPLLLGVVAVRRLFEKGARRLVVLALLVLALAGAAFSYAPVAQYASLHDAAFNHRMRRVSVFKTTGIGETMELLTTASPRRTQVLEDIWRSAIAHAQMFHVRGDRNGRHNLPHEPMLDPITGACFAVGFVLCVLQFWEPRKLMLLAWFGAMIASGIFSLPFEAPQAGRTNGNAAVVALIAALPLAGLIAIGRRRQPLGRIAVAAVALALVAAGVSNWRTFFDRQLWHPHSWAAWSTPETKIAHTIAALDRDTDVYVPPVYFGGPTIEFVLDAPLDAIRFDRDRDLPFATRDRDALLFVHHEEEDTLDLVRAYYPDAEIEAFAAPTGDGGFAKPVLWLVRVSQRSLDESRGWQVATVVDGITTGVERQTSTVWSWPDPEEAGRVELHVRGRWKIANDGEYELSLEHPGAAALQIDGEPILAGPGTATVSLARGVHAVELTMSAGGGGSRLTWRAAADDEAPRPLDAATMLMPVPGLGGLLGRYIDGTDCDAEPVFSSIDANISYRYHVPPLRRPFSVRWSGSIYAPASSSYDLATRSMDGSTLRVDGKQVVVNDEPRARIAAKAHLDQGWHDIDVCFRSGQQQARIFLEWRPPGAGWQTVPTRFLRPPGPGGERLARDAVPPSAARAAGEPHG